MEAVLDAGGEEVNDLGEAFEVLSEATDLVPVRTALQDAGIEYDSADVVFWPATQIEVDAEGARKILRLIDALEDSDDVQNVYANFDASDEVMAELERATDRPKPPGRVRWSGRASSSRAWPRRDRAGPAATMTRVRVLGVDPGLTRCGLGVVDGLPGAAARRWSPSASPRSDALWDVDQRLLSIERQIEEWLEEHAPDAVAVERVFAQHNLRTVMGTAQVGGHRDGRRRASAASPSRCTRRARSRRRSPATGRADKAQVPDDGPAAAAASTSSRGPPTPRTRSRSPSATSGGRRSARRPAARRPAR